MKQCQEIKQNWIGQENLEICFCVILATSSKFLFAVGRLGASLSVLFFFCFFVLFCFLFGVPKHPPVVYDDIYNFYKFTNYFTWRHLFYFLLWGRQTRCTLQYRFPCIIFSCFNFYFHIMQYML